MEAAAAAQPRFLLGQHQTQRARLHRGPRTSPWPARTRTPEAAAAGAVRARDRRRAGGVEVLCAILAKNRLDGVDETEAEGAGAGVGGGRTADGWRDEGSGARSQALRRGRQLAVSLGGSRPRRSCAG